MKKFFSMLMVLVLLMGVWWLYGKVSVKETIVTAVAGEYEEAFEARGIIIRKEYPLTSGMKGTLHSKVPDGTRVPGFATVGYVYSEDADGKTVARLEEINNEITEYENMRDSTLLNLTDVDEINLRITEYSEKLAAEACEGNNSETQRILDEINLLIGRRRYLEGDSDGEADNIDKLEKEKAELEKKLKGKSEKLLAYYTDSSGRQKAAAGLYYSFADGYEKLEPDDAANLTADKINKIIKGESVGENEKNALCKIVDNSQWMISLITDKDSVKGMAEGDSVMLRFSGSGDAPVEARVHSFKKDGKNMILNIEGNRYVDCIFRDRVCTVDVIKNLHKGLQIPADAVYNKTGKGKVVEVRTTGGMVEKRVTVLYSPPDGTVIVKTGRGAGELLLYDDVVVRKKRN